MIATTALESPSILVVDDDPMMRALLAQMLSQCGHTRTVTVDSGRVAIGHLLAAPGNTDVIILDLHMPDMDGVEFIRKLADNNFTGSVALVSGSADRVLETATQLVRKLGLRSLGRLRKPFGVDHLRTLLRDWDVPAAVSPIREGRAFTCTAEELSRAVRERELVLFYQPQVELATGLVLGMEGLVRWNHPEHGLLAPDEFIPLAEESGVIREVTHFVLSEGIRQAQSWCEQGCDLSIALNVSIADLGALDFPDIALSLARAAGRDPGRITLEVSEHQVIKHLGTALDVLCRLKLKKFKLALDDFGTGYSSLAQLRDLPFDELKIDRSFVRESPTNATLRAICAASIRMAHELKMSVVAEGVEDRSELLLLRELGCEFCQGYGIARPMPASQVLEWCSFVLSDDMTGDTRPQ